jgi:hypothetical protein
MKPWTYLVFFIILVGCFFFGYNIRSRIHPCTEIKTDTIYKVDTISHIIIDKIPYYVQRIDSVIFRDTVFKNVDTMAILADYFAVHYFTRIWEDSILKVTMDDAISENEFIHNIFKYQILRPQQIINNIVSRPTYNRYIYAGLNVPVSFPKYSEAEVLLIYPRFYFGAGYAPGLPSLTIKAGTRIFDF